MGLRPQTLYGIADSPVGLAAYFLDHDARSYALIARVFDGQSEGLSRDDILDNITLTWLTNTAISGARLYWEYWGKGYFNSKGVSIPVAVSVFPDELYPAPRSWTERAFPKLIYYGFSGKPTTTGWDPPRIARAWVVLMKRLGYTRFVAQGGDWGNAVSEQMALQAPPELLGISTNMSATVPAVIAKALKDGTPPPSSLSADDRRA